MRQVKLLRLGLLSCLLSLLPLGTLAQEEEAFQVVRGGCTPELQAGVDDARMTRAPRRILRSYFNGCLKDLSSNGHFDGVLRFGIL